MASKSGMVVLTAAERKQQALAYRKMGYSFAAIGRLCGCSSVRAHAIVTEHLQELNEKCRNSAEELRTLELERLDTQELRLSTVIDALTPADLRHLARLEDTLLKVRQQRAKLLGLVIPTQVLVPVAATEKGRVEAVVSDPSLSALVDDARSWEPPRLVLAEPAAPPHAEAG